MTDFDVEWVGHDPSDMRERFDEINLKVKRRTNDALMETARKVKSDLENTSPVDTGEYSQSWYIMQVDYDEVWILNEAEHARHVMLPNSKMVGSAQADLPAQGILHNVKGVARKHKQSLNSDVAEQLRKMISALRVKT